MADGIHTATLRQAGPADAGALKSILSDAFHDDPVMNWALGGPGAIPALFQTMIGHVYLPRGRAYLIGDEGAALWLAHDGDKSLPAMAGLGLMARALLAGGPGVLARTSALGKAMDAHKPDAPHLYLFAIGVRGPARGQGLGGALLDPILAECDAAGRAVYLENSKPANHGFYASRGFETQAVFHAADGAPPLEAMWRAARPQTEHPMRDVAVKE